MLNVVELVRVRRKSFSRPVFGQRGKRTCLNYSPASTHSSVLTEELYDHRRRELVFEIDNFMYLKVSPHKGVRRFQVRGKLAPCYVGPFQIVARRGGVAYQLDLPPSLSAIHNEFQVSQLKKCLRVPTEVIEVAN